MPGEISGHTAVLPREVVELLGVRPGETVVDATVGAGGHAHILGEQLGGEGLLVGLDADPSSLEVARSNLSDLRVRVQLVAANFSELSEALARIGITRADVILADLGISSTQLDEAGRGFSFQRDGPLDMRINPGQKVTAADLVNGLREQQLGDLFYHNAQEFGGRRIAKFICEARRNSRITTTGRLADVVCRALDENPESRKSKIHPATRTFLALRMAVNRELPNLEALLEAAPGVVNSCGRIGVIAFHSVEDKIVKLDFRRRVKEGVYRVLTKKPVIASEDERKLNPRSRSAKLRVAERV